MRNLVGEFRQFVLRGNVVALAVGIVIGVAFTGVVQGLVRDFINPLIAVLFGKPDFSKFHFNSPSHGLFLRGFHQPAAHTCHLPRNLAPAQGSTPKLRSRDRAWGEQSAGNGRVGSGRCHGGR
jgi:hypothetical protein